MKKLLVLFAILIGFSASCLAYDPPTETFTATINAHVIHPFIIKAVEPDHHALPNIYKNSTRSLSDQNLICVFDISKENDLPVTFHFEGPATMENVTLNGEWYWSVQVPTVANLATGVLIPNPISWKWGGPVGAATPGTDDDEIAVDGKVTVYAYLKLTNLIAGPTAPAGPRTFTIKCTGSYDAI